jgi:hypothetical protein
MCIRDRYNTYVRKRASPWAAALTLDVAELACRP